MNKTCSVCTNPVRKTQLAYVVDGGKLRLRRACAGCIKKLGFTIVAAQVAKPCKCGKPATRCAECLHKEGVAAKKGGADVSAIIKAVKAQLSAYEKTSPAQGGAAARTEYVDGRVDALEGVISLLEGGRW